MTMTPKAVLDHLVTKYDANDLFHPGPYNSKGITGERIYLDEIGLKGGELYNHLVKLIDDKIGSLFNKGLYVCIATSSWEDTSNYPKEDLEHVKKCGIKVPTTAAYSKKYISDEEWYRHYLLFEEQPENLRQYIHYSIANHIQEIESTYWPCDIFILNSTLNIMVNIYDDRGMDIIEL